MLLNIFTDFSLYITFLVIKNIYFYIYIVYYDSN